MDKVKQFLVVARRHHFWILCGVSALVCFIVYMMSTNKLDAERKTREAEIKGKFDAVAGIQAPHPNETWKVGMEKTTADARESVRAAWTLLFQEQREKIFKWPAELGNDFLKEIAKVEEGARSTLEEKFRVRYQAMIRDRFAKELPKIVDSEGFMDPTTTGNVAPQANPMEFVDHKVQWDQQSQQEIFSTFDWIESPSTPIVRQAQEELWVYEALCRVIAEVNKDAKGSHDAPIASIQQLSVAYLAQSATGGMGMSAGVHRVDRVKGSAPGAGGMDEMRGAPMAMTGAGGEPGAAAGTPPDPKSRCKGAAQAGGLGGRLGGLGPPAADPTAAAAGGNPDDIWKGFRYVNEEGKPLASAADVDSSPLEFNLMPFRMRLMINPKEIDSLLVAFRNSPLQLEVKEVHIGASGAAGSVGGPGPMMRGGFGGGLRGRMEGDFEGPRTAMPAMPTGEAGAVQQKTIQIEVAGVAYLMKKPDPAKLNITPEGGVPADGTAPAPVPAPSAMNVFNRKPIARHQPIQTKRSSASVISTRT